MAVTACIVGIAHGYLAATALKKAAAARGIKIKVETQGGLGVINQLSAEDVENADIVILAVDTEISGPERFEGKKVITVKVSETIKDADSVLEMALSKVG